MSTRQQRHDEARNAVSEKFKALVAEAVAEWDGQDDADLCRLIAEKTGHGFWLEAAAAPDLLALASRVAELTDGTFSSDDVLENLLQIGDDARHVIAKAEGR